MLKKLILGTAAIATLGSIVVGKDLWSYARSGFLAARDHVRHEVPMEFEITRARHEIERLLPEVRKSLHVIAEGQVEIARLQDSLQRRTDSLVEQEHSIRNLSSDLRRDDTRYTYAGRNYSRREVERDLNERFQRYKIAEETVKRDQQVLAAKERSLAANRETLETMLSQRKRLEAELERLDARWRTVQARQQIQGLSLDDSRLNRVRSQIALLEKRLDVEDAVLAAEGDLTGLIPIEKDRPGTEDDDVLAAVDRYFEVPAERRLSEAHENGQATSRDQMETQE
jgi:hypothetical protein